MPAKKKAAPEGGGGGDAVDSNCGPVEKRFDEAIIHFYGKLPPCADYPNYSMTNNPKVVLQMNPIFRYGGVDPKKRFRVIFDYDPEFPFTMTQIKEDPNL